MGYDWDFSVLNTANAKVLMVGFGTTLLITFVSVAIGTPLGVLVGGLARFGRSTIYSGNDTPHRRGASRDVFISTIRIAAIVYIDVVRAIPLLLLILSAYYALPMIAGALAHWLGATSSPEVTAFQSSAVAISVNLSAFIADLVRGAVAGVPKGDILAAKSLGMPDRLVWRRIILPEVAREILPGMTMLYITTLKMSTLASAVTVYEVLHSADAIIQQTYRPLELYCIVCLLFVITIVPLSAFARRLESSRVFLRRPS